LSPILIEFYKSQDPFYYYDPTYKDDENSNSQLEYKSFITKQENWDIKYEGEVDKNGDSNGKGISIWEDDE